VRVLDIAAVVLPTAVFGNVSTGAVIEIAGDVPVPVSEICCGLPVALLGRDRMAK